MTGLHLQQVLLRVGAFGEKSVMKWPLIYLSSPGSPVPHSSLHDLPDPL